VLLISREIEIYQQLLFKALNLGDKQTREPTVIEGIKPCRQAKA
jgi:hypothetical protein